MTAAKKLNLISVDDYLAGELVSSVKHEYLGGVVYAISGARNVHNTIAGNSFAFCMADSAVNLADHSIRTLKFESNFQAKFAFTIRMSPWSAAPIRLMTRFKIIRQRLSKSCQPRRGGLTTAKRKTLT
jgi:hypothetical protein